MTPIKTFTVTMTALVFGIALSACSQANKQESKLETADTNSAIIDTTAEAIPASAPADNSGDGPQETPQDDHAGHDHGPGGHNHDHDQPLDQAALDIDHVFDFAEDDHLIGAADAPVKMIVYASVTCGHCGEWFTTDWPVIKSKYIDNGKLQMAFREIPTAPQEIAIPGFIIANCAPEDKYMDIIVHQMQNQKATFDSIQAGTGEQTFVNLAAKAGMASEAEIQTCFEDPAHIERLNRASARMRASKINGVPGIVINGDVFADNDKSAAALSIAIDKLLR